MKLDNITSTNDLIEFLLDQFEQTGTPAFLAAANSLYLYQKNCYLLAFSLDQQNKWIGVEDRLPENDSYVLCWYEYKAMDGTHEGEMIQKYGIGYYFKGWHGEVSYGCDTRVTHWMPLPEPPKEGEL